MWAALCMPAGRCDGSAALKPGAQRRRIQHRPGPCPHLENGCVCVAVDGHNDLQAGGEGPGCRLYCSSGTAQQRRHARAGTQTTPPVAQHTRRMHPRSTNSTAPPGPALLDDMPATCWMAPLMPTAGRRRAAGPRVWHRKASCAAGLECMGSTGSGRGGRTHAAKDRGAAPAAGGTPAMYRSGATTLPVWPTCGSQGRCGA